MLIEKVAFILGSSKDGNTLEQSKGCS